VPYSRLTLVGNGTGVGYLNAEGQAIAIHDFLQANGFGIFDVSVERVSDFTNYINVTINLNADCSHNTQSIAQVVATLLHESGWIHNAFLRDSYRIPCDTLNDTDYSDVINIGNTDVTVHIGNEPNGTVNNNGVLYDVNGQAKPATVTKTDSIEAWLAKAGIGVGAAVVLAVVVGGVILSRK